MTVRELIELNQMITDVQITVRRNGCLLLDQLNIGPAEGEKPRFPTRVPRKPEYAGSSNQHCESMYKDAAYIAKSINSWDDGKDYWQVKVNRIPAQWLDLEVYSWSVWPASTVCYTSPRRTNGTAKFSNVNFNGERLNVVALPSGAKLEVKQPKQIKPDEQLEGQISIEDWNYEVKEI